MSFTDLGQGEIEVEMIILTRVKIDAVENDLRVAVAVESILTSFEVSSIFCKAVLKISSSLKPNHHRRIYLA